MIANTVFLNVRAMVNDRAGNQLFIDSIISGSAIMSISPKLGGRPGCDIYLLNGQVVTVSDHIDDLRDQLSGQRVPLGNRLRSIDQEEELLTPPSVEEIMAELRAKQANAERRAAEQLAREAEVRRLAAEEGIELEPEEDEDDADLADVIEFGGRSGADTTDFLDEDDDDDDDDFWSPEDGDDL